jgi:hypothetical protein
MTADPTGLIVELAKVKAIFQQRAILSAMGVVQRDLVEPELERCDICGDVHEGVVPRECETGDGV